jgi:hypothetical protein
MSSTSKKKEEEAGPHMGFAVAFGIVGGMALSKFLDPSTYTIGPGTLAAVGLGVTWPILAVARRRWDSGEGGLVSARLLLGSAAAAAIVSGLAAVAAILFAVKNGLTIDISGAASSTRPVRGAWLLWLFPTLACLLTTIAFFVAKREFWTALQYWRRKDKVAE